MRRCTLRTLLLLPALLPAPVFGWGCVGHQVVAYIASQNFNSTAAAQVADLLSDAKSQYHFKRFCAATNLGNIEFFATWADDARTDDNAAWHFWDIPLGTDTASVPEFCDNGCVVTALKEKVAILNDPNAARSDKQQALLFVIHLVGDAHQPMHIVDNGDRGGNCVPVSFEVKGFSHKTTAEQTNGQPTGSYSPNLHSTWDDNVIETMTGVEKADNRDQLTQAFADSVAKEHAKQIKAAKDASVDLTGGSDFTSWALDAHKLAGPNSYDKMPAHIPVNAHPPTLKSCAGVSSRFVKLKETASDDFDENAKPVIRQQLALAGARLAATLNTIWPAQ